MKRENFIKIIRLRSYWKVDKRKGNYTLLNGEKLDSYIYDLVRSQLKVDNLGIASDGNMYTITDKYNLIIPFSDYEKSNWEEQSERVEKLVKEIVG